VKLRNRRPRPEPGDTQGTWTLGPDTELYEPYEDVPPYRVRDAHPMLHTLARAGLWGAVVIGCLGGLAGLASPGARPQQAPRDDTPAESTEVPGPVAGVAVRAVTAWLTATDRDELSALFVEAPPAVSGDPVTVVRADAVGGEATRDGTWTVTVAADVVVPPTDEDEDEPVESTWYAAVTVVGDGSEGLQALAAPALVPPPPEVEGWRSRPREARRLDDEDPLVTTITGFLEALVVGQGDPAPYLAPGVELAPVRPAPFTALEVDEIAARRTDEGEARLWVEATGTAGRASYAVAYQIDVVRRDGRWQVAAVAGAPAGGGAAATTGGAEEPVPVDGGAVGGAGATGPVPVDGRGTDPAVDATTVTSDPVTTLDDEALRGEGLLDDVG
jgi:hypothetical protein